MRDEHLRTQLIVFGGKDFPEEKKATRLTTFFRKLYADDKTRQGII